jgi:branched-chain amino acid aminotransferase
VTIDASVQVQINIDNNTEADVTQYAFFKGSIVPIEQAKLSIMTHVVNYGTGCFEGIRAYWNEYDRQLYAFRMLEHYQRMMHSTKIMMMTPQYTAEQLCDVTVELLRKEGFQSDAYIRPLAYKTDEIISVRLHNMHDDLFIFTTPFGRYVENEEGAHVGFSSWKRISDNNLPPRGKITGAYVNSAFIKTEAELNGYDEALVLNERGHVCEGSAENVFLVRGGKLITPPVEEDILEGITRNTIIELARNELGLETVERPISRTEFYVADAAFFCGTGVQVANISRVDHRIVGNGQFSPVVKAIRDLYFDVVRGKVVKYKHWCAPIYAEEPGTV